MVDHRAAVAEQAARRGAVGRSQGAQRRLPAAAHRFAMGGDSRALRTIDDLLQPFRPLGQDRRLGSDIRGDLKSLRRRFADDRQFLDPRPPAWCERQKRGPEETASAARDLAGTRCMGRSRGGLTTKIHALVDANGLPILLKLTPGQAHDGRSADDMLDGLGQGQILLGDRGYDSDALRTRLASQGAWGNIKPMPNRVNVPCFSAYLYRFRNLVECFFNKLKHFRAVATRYEKHDANYLALVKLAAIRIWFRFMSR